MFSDYATHLVTRRQSPGTVRLRLFYMDKFAAWFDDASGRTVMNAKTGDLWDYLASNPDWMANTEAIIIATFRSFYKWAHLYELRTDNPALALQRPRSPRRRGRIAPENVVTAGIERGTTVERALLRLGAECGLRAHEIAKVRREDRDGPWLTVCGKGGAIRVVFLNPELLVDLEEIESTSMRHGYYFPGQSRGSIHPSTVWRRVKKVIQMNPHSLRHRAGTTVYRNSGYDLRLTQEFLGHFSSATTEIYVHIERDDMMRAAAASRISARVKPALTENRTGVEVVA